MSSTPAPTRPRVRQQAREALAVMAFSLAASMACCVALLLLSGLGR
ncbi:hypothetical protein [Nocardioides limicola]|nr:hypothetical protein [Nocardioides sp. DJM-14]